MAGPTTEGKTDGDFIELGGRLREARQQGRAEFESLVRTEGLKSRKAYYLVSIADAFEEPRSRRDEFLALGWTKLEMLRHKRTVSNFDELLKQAQKLPVPELRRVLADQEPLNDRRVMSLSFSADQFKVVMTAISDNAATDELSMPGGREAALVRALQAAKKADGKEIDDPNDQ